jgi:hypothetical protein
MVVDNKVEHAAKNIGISGVSIPKKCGELPCPPAGMLATDAICVN